MDVTAICLDQVSGETESESMHGKRKSINTETSEQRQRKRTLNFNAACTSGGGTMSPKIPVPCSQPASLLPESLRDAFAAVSAGLPAIPPAPPASMVNSLGLQSQPCEFPHPMPNQPYPPRHTTARSLHLYLSTPS